MSDKKRHDPAHIARALIRQNRELAKQNDELLRFIESGLPPIDENTFVPNPTQEAILTALQGKGLRTDALASKCDCNRRSLFKDPGGIPELQEEGLVAHHPRVGYYRPDAPPPNLSQLTAS